MYGFVACFPITYAQFQYVQSRAESVDFTLLFETMQLAKGCSLGRMLGSMFDPGFKLKLRAFTNSYCPSCVTDNLLVVSHVAVL